MKYLGTLIGAAVGLFVLHSVFLALLGAAVGYGFDVNRAQRQRRRRAINFAFVAPLFGLLGAVAKSDGRVTTREIKVAERMMQQLQLDALWRSRAINAFNAGKEPDFDAAHAVARLRQWTGGYPELAWSVIDVLADTVLAEGQPTARKMQLLQMAASGLGIHPLQLTAMLAMKGYRWSSPGGGARGPQPGPGPGPRAQRRRQAPGGNGSGVADPYAVLGLPPDADDATVKRTWRKLMSEHHPDRLGDLPEDLRRRAAERASAINAAWDEIKKRRGLR